MKNLRNINTRKSLTAMAGRILEDAKTLATVHAGELFEENSSSREQELMLQAVRELKEASRLVQELLKRSDPAMSARPMVIAISGMAKL